MSQKISLQMEKYGTIVKSLTVPEIASALIKFGYTPEVISNITRHYEDTVVSVLNQEKENKEKFFATQNFIKLRDEIDTDFSNDKKICSLAFASDDKLSLIVPPFIRISPYDKWFDSLTKMYHNILNIEGALDKLKRFNYSAEDINARLNRLNTLSELKAEKLKEKSEAESATIKRNDMVDELTVTCREISEIAKIAFDKKSQLLEIMGIITKS
jgi:hypothetical protein